jgi:hypothetical protein
MTPRIIPWRSATYDRPVGVKAIRAAAGVGIASGWSSGFASGEIPSLPLNQLLLRNRSVIVIDWGIMSQSQANDRLVGAIR